ncbi:MAG: hypothetical protein HOI23_21710 [Deltaproteobacteria bacterium]|jgi:hypothetical protein|nr:hypothetical protein [Deltaproteobacteria bacterium]
MVTVTTILLTLTACDGVSRLRSFFHPDESPQGLEGSTSLSLEITPAVDLDIFLDGELVAHASPYAARFLPAGPHRLLIEAKGYHPFSLVLNLNEEQALEFPVSLRPMTKDTKVSPATQGSGGPALGPDIKPARIAVQSALQIAPTIDGQPIEAGQELKRTWGNIAAGTFSVTYRYDQFGRLEIALPGYAARWVVNDKEVEPGSTHPFYEGKLVIIEERAKETPRNLTLVRQ